MIAPTKVKYGGLLALVLLAQSHHAAVDAKSCSVSLKSSLSTTPFCSSKSASPLSVPATLSASHDEALVSVKDAIDNVLERRGGADEEGTSAAVRLKVGGYFALWYILNIVYNSECHCRAVCSFSFSWLLWSWQFLGGDLRFAK